MSAGFAAQHNRSLQQSTLVVIVVRIFINQLLQQTAAAADGADAIINSLF